MLAPSLLPYLMASNIFPTCPTDSISEMSFIHLIFTLLLSNIYSACYMETSTLSSLKTPTMKIADSIILTVQMKKRKQSLSSSLDSHIAWTLERTFTPGNLLLEAKLFKTDCLPIPLLSRFRACTLSPGLFTPRNSPFLSFSKKRWGDRVRDPFNLVILSSSHLRL